MANYSVYGKTINGGAAITVTKQPGVETQTIGFSSVPVLGIGQEVKLVWRAFVHNAAVVREEVLESYGGVYRYGVTNEMESLVGETITAQLQVKFAGSVWRSAPFSIAVAAEVHITTLPELVDVVTGHTSTLAANATTVAGHTTTIGQHTTAIGTHTTQIAALKSPAIVDVAESKTLALTDAGKMLKVTADPSAVTLTIPENETVAFPVGTRIEIMSYSDFDVTVTSVEGVVLYSNQSHKNIGPDCVATLIKMQTDEWCLYGTLKAAE